MLPEHIRELVWSIIDYLDYWWIADLANLTIDTVPELCSLSLHKMAREAHGRQSRSAKFYVNAGGGENKK